MAHVKHAETFGDKQVLRPVKAPRSKVFDGRSPYRTGESSCQMGSAIGEMIGKIRNGYILSMMLAKKFGSA
jgi:hypothetical protein